MFCPKCQNEYRKGIVICPECNIELVEELSAENTDEELVAVAALKDVEVRDKICKYLSHVGIKNEASEETDNEGNLSYVIHVPFSKENEAANVIATIAKIEAENKLKDRLAESPEEVLAEAEKEAEELRKLANQKTYVKTGDRSNDYKSSGRLFTVFGLLLAVFGILNVTGVISLFNAAVSLIVIFLMAALFLIYGIYSVRKGASLTGAAKEEEEKEAEIKAFIRENITKEKLDALNDDDLSPELLYLKQSDHVKDFILKSYPDIDEEYADVLTEEFMNSIYND